MPEHGDVSTILRDTVVDTLASIFGGNYTIIRINSLNNYIYISKGTYSDRKVVIKIVSDTYSIYLSESWIYQAQAHNFMRPVWPPQATGSLCNPESIPEIIDVVVDMVTNL